MKISVVTVCLNAASTIAGAVGSFLRQDHPDKELIIVDGASRDDTLAIVAGFPQDRITVISEPDRGLYEAMNKGLAHYAGDAIGFLNADDAFHDDTALSQIAGGLGGADIVFGNLDYVAGHGEARVVRRWQGSSFSPGAFRRGWMPAHPTFYVRRQVADAVGPFDLGYALAADYDWMLRACEMHGFDTVFVDRTLVDMAAGGRSTSGPVAYLRHNLEALQSRRKWIGTGMVDLALVAKPMRKVTQFLHR